MQAPEWSYNRAATESPEFHAWSRSFASCGIAVGLLAIGQSVPIGGIPLSRGALATRGEALVVAGSLQLSAPLGMVAFGAVNQAGLPGQTVPMSAGSAGANPPPPSGGGGASPNPWQWTPSRQQPLAPRPGGTAPSGDVPELSQHLGRSADRGRLSPKPNRLGWMGCDSSTRERASSPEMGLS